MQAPRKASAGDQTANNCQRHQAQQQRGKAHPGGEEQQRQDGKRRQKQQRARRVAKVQQLVQAERINTRTEAPRRDGVGNTARKSCSQQKTANTSMSGTSIQKRPACINGPAAIAKSANQTAHRLVSAQQLLAHVPQVRRRLLLKELCNASGYAHSAGLPGCLAVCGACRQGDDGSLHRQFAGWISIMRLPHTRLR